MDGLEEPRRREQHPGLAIPQPVLDRSELALESVDSGVFFLQPSIEGLDRRQVDAVGIDQARRVNELSDAEVLAIREQIGDRPVYLTFDIDCLDPSYAPGTGTPVCGGLTSHQAMAILRGLEGINVIGMDVVEVAPAYDVGEITALAAAHIAMEMLYLYACRQAGN